jgi:hypothetical protein
MLRSSRPFRVRRSLLLLITTMLGLAAMPFPQPPASASCAGPYVKVSSRLVFQRGATVTIEGRSFTNGGCRDSMGCTGSLGCESCEYDDPPPTPMDDVGLRLVQRGHTWTLGAADAGSSASNQLGWVSWSFVVPHGVKPGPARLLAERAQPVRVLIR